MTSANYRVKFKPLCSKTINMNLFSSGLGLVFFLGSTPRYPSLLLLFLLVEDSTILDTRNDNRNRNILFLYCSAFLHLEFARIDACNVISLVYTENAMVGVDVSLITQINYTCTTQDKLWHSTKTTLSKQKQFYIQHSGLKLQ